MVARNSDTNEWGVVAIWRIAEALGDYRKSVETPAALAFAVVVFP